MTKDTYSLFTIKPFVALLTRGFPERIAAKLNDKGIPTTKHQVSNCAYGKKFDQNIIDEIMMEYKEQRDLITNTNV